MQCSKKMIKNCVMCGTPFKSKGGTHKCCSKECREKYTSNWFKEYRKENKDALYTKQKIWRIKNREHVKVRSRNYRIVNREEYNEYAKNWFNKQYRTNEEFRQKSIEDAKQRCKTPEYKLYKSIYNRYGFIVPMPLVRKLGVKLLEK